MIGGHKTPQMWRRIFAEVRPNSCTLPSRTFGGILRPNFGVRRTSVHLYCESVELWGQCTVKLTVICAQCWLDREKLITKQVPTSEPHFRFLLKFYTPDPVLLEDEFTRFITASCYVLQMTKCVEFTGNLFYGEKFSLSRPDCRQMKWVSTVGYTDNLFSFFVLYFSSWV